MSLNDDDRQRRTMVELARYSGYGLTLGLATALFAWFGSVLDERLHTGPLFVILGTFTGFGAGFYSMYRHLVVDERTKGRDRDPPDEEEPG